MSATGAPLSPHRQPPRRARLRSPRVWFLSQPRVQAVVYHPKVQWAMTNLGIRRWLTIRRWPPLFLVNGWQGTVMDHMHGPRWQYDLVGLFFSIAVIVIGLSTDAYLTRRARRLVGLRSRPTYLAMGTGLLALAVGCFIAVGSLDAHNTPWLGDVFMLIGLLAGWPALLALGRALTWGRLRRLCWVYPPAPGRAVSPDQTR